MSILLLTFKIKPHNDLFMNIGLMLDGLRDYCVQSDMLDRLLAGGGGGGGCPSCRIISTRS